MMSSPFMRSSPPPTAPTCYFQPFTSSPPASPKSSPVADAQARRRLQYKARFPATATPRRVAGVAPEDPHRAFLRERLRTQCFERAARERERIVEGRRWRGRERPNDEEEVQADEEDEDVLKDELFRRIVDFENRRRDHAYRLSYQHEVGSSFDPAEEQVQDIPQENEPEQEDLADYADEYVNYVGLEEIADELFEWSDWDAEDAPPGSGGDVDMAS